MAVGYIYVLQNDAFPHLLKIGMTTRSPEDRAAELSSTGVPHPFQVLFSWQVSDCGTAEWQVHQALTHARANADREFFAVTPQEAERVITGILGASPGTPADITPGGCLGVMVFVGICWGLMQTFGELNPPENSWGNRLWWMLYSLTATAVILFFETLSVMLHGRKKEGAGTSIIQTIAGLFLLYFGFRFIRSFF